MSSPTAPAHTCPVWRFIIVTKHTELLPLPDCYLGHEGHEVVGAAKRVLPNAARRMRAHWVEVPKGN
ncbi:hypothetical protein E2C01_006403 [Portunus trituberculatus]|uniref:Uncharacterized protein n=1 Tax=Portunus trituberculatus TaxID=210409 RepID=A0A5B7CV53_PORTR|nr:hypothetical protein [Portunus trituberculatus]